MKACCRLKISLARILVIQTLISSSCTLIFPFGMSAGDTTLTGETSPSINLDTPFPFYGGSYKSIKIYEDGFMTFDDNGTRNVYMFDSQELVFPAVAPWLAIMDATRSAGNVFYRLTTNSTVLNEIASFTDPFIDFINFVPAYAFIATWNNMGTNFYDSSTNNKVDTIQAVLASDGVKSLVLFHYIKLEWIYADNPSYYDDYGDIQLFPEDAFKTQIGFHKGDNASSVRLALSNTPGLFDIVNGSNVNQTSVYAFRVDVTPTNLTDIATSSTETTTSTTSSTETTTLVTSSLSSASSTKTTTSEITQQTDTKLIIGLCFAATLSFLFLIVIIILCCKLKCFSKSERRRSSSRTSVSPFP